MGRELSSAMTLVPIVLLALFWPIVAIIAVRALRKISTELEALNEHLRKRP